MGGRALPRLLPPPSAHPLCDLLSKQAYIILSLSEAYPEVLASKYLLDSYCLLEELESG